MTKKEAERMKRIRGGFTEKEENAAANISLQKK